MASGAMSPLPLWWGALELDGRPGPQDGLTATAALRPLIGPPQRILAFADGNGFQDEAILTAVWQAGRLWLSANDQCQVDPDPDFHACARFISLDTTVNPAAVVEHADFVDLDRDTFAPLVGLSRDGTAYFLMSASSATVNQPIDEYATYRDVGDTILAGADEVPFRHNGDSFSLLTWSRAGSVIADPLDSHAVTAVYPTFTYLQASSGAHVTRMVGDLDASAGGTFTLGNECGSGPGWTSMPRMDLKLIPDPASPILWVRFSASPETESSADGDRLRYATEVPSSLLEFADLSSTALGGVPGASTITAYVQWRTADGPYSEPVAQSVKVDAVRRPSRSRAVDLPSERSPPPHRSR